MVVHNKKNILSCDSWYFHIKGVDGFHVVIFGPVKFNFNFCFKVWFGRLNISANYVSATHLIEEFFKLCGTRGDMLLLLNEFLWKLGRSFLENLGTLWESKCLWFDIGKFISNLLWLFMLFYLNWFSSFS